MSLRIMQVASGLTGWAGTEKHIFEASMALRNRGHSVTIACPSDSLLIQRAKQMQLSTLPIEMLVPDDWRQLPRLVGAIRGKYDIVHTHSAYDYLVPALAARIGKVSAIVMTRHMPQPFASAIRARICARLYDRIIAVSDFIRTLLVRSGARADRIDVVHNGVSPAANDTSAAVRLRKDLGIPANSILIAAAGRIEAGKGFDVLLRAVEQLICRGADVYCAIFGSGRQFEQLGSLARELRVDSRVRLPGFRSDVRDLWNAADIVTIPSVAPESFSYTAAEALAAARPIVATRIGALPEVLSSDAVIFAEPGNVAGLAAAIGKLVSSPDLRSCMQYAARERSKVFTLERTVINLERVYARVLRAKSGIQASLSIGELMR